MNKGHLKKAGWHSDRNVVLHLSTIKMRITVRKITQNIIGFLSITYFHIYIYIYIWIFWQHFFININFVEYNRHFLSTYFLVDPFILPYWSCSIRRELIDVSSIIVYFLSMFCSTMGHHQERMYYKSDVTFVCTKLLCKKKKRIWVVAVCSVYF